VGTVSTLDIQGIEDLFFHLQKGGSLRENKEEMNKRDLNFQLAKKAKISRRLSKEIVDLFFQIVVKGLREGRSVTLRRFGRFWVERYPPVWKVNPKTGKKVILPPRNLPRFRKGEGINTGSL
jgi:nucleoid DNA-binding protein